MWKMRKEVKKDHLKVGIVGLGYVGGALKHALDFFFEVSGYDIKGKYDWTKILASDIVFVCVPTDGGKDGRLDCSQVTNVLEKLRKDDYTGIVVIRSTLRVGYMEFATKSFPTLRLVYSPEFLRQRSRLQWTVNPDRIVMSGKEEDVKKALEFFRWAEEAEILVMDYRSAEIGKLANNAFIATKVSFTNEIQSICEKLGADPEKVMSVIMTDRRVRSKEHLRPYLGGYGGSCIPKDTMELITSAGNPVLLSAVNEVNKKAKKERK